MEDPSTNTRPGKGPALTTTLRLSVPRFGPQQTDHWGHTRHRRLSMLWWGHQDQIPLCLPYYKIPDSCKRNLLSAIMHCEEYYWILSFIHNKIQVAGYTFSGKLLLINSNINISLLGWIFSGKCYPLESMFSHTYIFKVLSKVTMFFILFHAHIPL